MSWHFKFAAKNKEAISIGLNRHMALVDSDFLCELTTEMLTAVRLLEDNDGIEWIVESFGHVGRDGCNFTFKVEPINSTENYFYTAVMKAKR